MAFEYFNSEQRRNYFIKKGFSDNVFYFASFFNLVIIILAILIFIKQDLTNIGYGEILLAIALSLQSYLLAKKYTIYHLDKSNPVNRFDLALIDYFEILINEARKENIQQIEPEYVFQKASLCDEGKMMMMRLGVSYETKSKNSPQNFKPAFSPQLINLISLIKSEVIVFEDLMLQIVESSEPVKEFLKDITVSEKEIKPLLDWLRKMHEKPKRSWEDDTLVAGVGEDWSFGYSPVLSRYSYDLSKHFPDPHLHLAVFGHSDIISEMETVLSKPGKNNVLLVGEPGVGKKTIVNALALKMAQGKSVSALHYKRIKQLDVGSLLAGAAQGELEARINGALSDAVNAGNLILYIDNFQSLVGGYEHRREEVGGIDASQFILPYLQSSGLQVIASITPDEYFDRVKSNSSVAESFEKIDVEPANAEDTFAIMLQGLNLLEYKYKTIFTAQVLKEIIKLSDRYMHEVPFPQEAAVTFASTNFVILQTKQIDELISKKAHVPVGDVKEEEKDKLLNLESFLHQRVIGQEDAITAVADALRRARSGLTSGKRPVGVFLFMGPTGVGKTETAKALAESYFGSEKQMIRLDMSEYQDANSLDRLIGTVNNPNGILNVAIEESPFSLILLDELEKADKNILNLFLSVFEDGRMTDPRGKVLDFTNSIIIATSNAGSELIREKVAANQADGLKELLIEDLQQKGVFTPEFINRFDGVIVFKPLTEDQTAQVAQLMINQLNIQLKDKNITVEVAEDALAKLSQIGYDPQFGARPMRRVIQERVENLLAKKMLSGEIGEHQTVQIGLEEIK